MGVEKAMLFRGRNEEILTPREEARGSSPVSKGVPADQWSTDVRGLRSDSRNSNGILQIAKRFRLGSLWCEARDMLVSPGGKTQPHRGCADPLHLKQRGAARHERASSLMFPVGFVIRDDLTEKEFEAPGRNFVQILAEMAEILFEAIEGARQRTKAQNAGMFGGFK